MSTLIQARPPSHAETRQCSLFPIIRCTCSIPHGSALSPEVPLLKPISCPSGQQHQAAYSPCARVLFQVVQKAVATTTPPTRDNTPHRVRRHQSEEHGAGNRRRLACTSPEQHAGLGGLRLASVADQRHGWVSGQGRGDRNEWEYCPGPPGVVMRLLSSN